MITVNTHEAKTTLSKLLARVEQSEEEVTICRNGKPVARLVPAIESRPPDPLETHAELQGIAYVSPTEATSPLANEDWPEELR